MKKFTLPIFLISFVALICVMTFFVIKENGLKDSASGKDTPPPQTEDISIYVDSSVKLLVGQSKQLYLTVRPSNALVEVSFDNENIASIDGGYMLTAIGAGQTNCLILVTHKEKSSFKSVPITVVEKNVEFLLQGEIFFVGEQENYVMTIKSNFYIESDSIKTCDNVLIKNVSNENSENNYFYYVTFCLEREDYFQFKVYDVEYKKIGINRPSFEMGFYENGVYDSNNNLITLYSNISQQSLAEENGHNSKASFIQDLTNFKLSVKDTKIVKIENNKIVALTNGATFVEILSDIDSQFYLKINVIVKSLSLACYDVFVNDNQINTNQPVTLYVGENAVLSIINLLPIYANFEVNKQFILSNENLVFDENLNTISAQEEGTASLEININDIIKTIYFEIIQIPEDILEEVVILKFTGTKNSAIIFNNEEEDIIINASSYIDVFYICIEKDGETVSFEQIEFFVIDPINPQNSCNLRGANFEVQLVESVSVRFAYQDYQFVINFVLS